MLNLRDKIIAKALLNSLANKKYKKNYFDDIEKTKIQNIDDLSEIISNTKNASILKNDESNKFFNLESIYNSINPKNTQKFIYEKDIKEISNDIIYPIIKENKHKDLNIEEVIQTIFTNKEKLSINKILKIIEDKFSLLQSINFYNNKINASFYDEILMKTALIVNTLDYVSENMVEINKEIVNKKTVLLASFDFSGIQRFVFDIPTEGSLRNMRARSFYLEILAKTFSHEILAKLELSQTNIVYIGGGHGYLLLPNTKKAKNVFIDVVETYNNYLLETYKYNLFLSTSLVETSINDLLNTNKEDESSFMGIMGKVFSGISDKKKHKYSIEILNKLNDVKILDNLRECRSCGNSNLLISNSNICENCQMLLCFSKIITDNTLNIFVLLKDKLPNNNNYLIIPYDKNIAYLYGLKEKEYNILIKDNTKIIETFEKNNSNKVSSSSNIYIADNAVRGLDGNQLSIEDIVKTKVTGIKRIAMLKLDVDSLGMIFKEGFINNDYNIFGMKSLSDSLSLFFKNHVNTLAEKYDTTIIFSGGDDTFLLGNLEDVLNFTNRLHVDFNRYVIGKLTFSAAIGVFSPKYPIYKVVDYMDDLLLEAKSIEGKNGITLFESEYTIKFNEFNNLIENKDIGSDLYLINNVIGKGLISGTVLYSKIYKSLSTLSMKDKSVTHRFAYMLGRIRKDLDKEILNENVELFNALTNKLISCTNYNNKEERKILLIAIQIYIYTNRIREEV